MRKTIFFILLVISLGTAGQVKTTGVPYIRNYPKSVYDAGTQNWEIVQDKNGFMYFANNNGILRFDGRHWDLIPVFSTSPVRSVAIDEAGNIYAGLFDDFGMLTQSAAGETEFRSLKHLLPPEMESFGEIWKIYEIQGTIFFQSFEYIFVLNNGQIRVIHPQTRFHFSFKVNERLFVHEPQHGLFEYRGGRLDRLPWSGNLTGKEIRGIAEVQPNVLLIATDRDGIYKAQNGMLEKWNVPVSEFCEQNILFSAAKIGEAFYAFGTITNGIVISDGDGRIIQHLNKNRGLQNNTVLSVFTDHDQNLWLGLDNGIDFVEINSPLSEISDFQSFGAGYCAQVFDGKLYLGTNQGLYATSFDNFSGNNLQFELVENTTGQVWSLEVFDDQLICGHNLGTFFIEGYTAFPVSLLEGSWGFIGLNDNEELLLGGHYNGLQLLKKGESSWEYFKTIKGFKESSRFLMQDSEGTIWMSHGGKGVFGIRLSENFDSVVNYTHYTTTHGLPSNEQNILFSYLGNVYVSTISGVYSFNTDSGKFSPATFFAETFSLESRLKTFVPDSEGNYWFIAEDEAGVFRLNEDLSYTKITDPFKPLEDRFIHEFEFIYPFSNDHVFIGIEDGFAHYSSKFLKSYNFGFQSFITKVELPNADSVIFLQPGAAGVDYSFPYKRNAFRFHFTAPFFDAHSSLQFSFFLENYDDQWSEWSPANYRDFTNLREGEYVFQVKARNIYGYESGPTTFRFRVQPPWYRSNLAYLLYLLSFGSVIFGVIYYSSKRSEAARRKEIEKHKKDMLEREQAFRQQNLLVEKENVQLRNEKLQTEMIHRDKDLANQTMNIIRKNEFLVKLQEELQRLQKSTTDGSVKTKLIALGRRISKELDSLQQNQMFETYFEEVHTTFFERLRTRYPDLTAREMKLSAYIRMNLTTKEIASLLNISDRGVEIARYRLRKKLNLERETNLTTFLLNV